MRAAVGAAILAVTAGCASPRYLAKVNDETLTQKEVRLEFSRHHAALEDFLAQDADIRKYVDRLVDRRLFVQEGYRMDLHESPDVREDMARIRAQKMVELFRKEEVEAKATVSEEEVKAIYAQLGQRIEVRQIVVATKEQADAIAAELAAGKDMQKVARERSIAPSAKMGGMLQVGWGLDEAYEKVLFPLADATVSPPFKSQAGWEVARVEKRNEVKLPPYEKAQSSIRQVLARRKRIAREEEVYAGLWAKYEAKILECAPDIASLRTAAERLDQTECATWRGGKITAAALAARVKLDQLDQMEQAKTRWHDMRRFLVEDLVNRELVLLEGEALGYGGRPEVADRLTVMQDDLVESKLYRDHVVKGITASDEDAKAYYDANTAMFVDDQQYELAQVLVETEEVANEVVEKIRTRQPFAEIAQAYSKDRRNAASGGTVGFAKKRMLQKEFAPVAALQEGEVSAPIKATDGYHVIKVLSIKPARQLTFEESKEEARASALQRKQKAEVDRWIGKLRDAATIKINERGIRAYGNEVREELKREQEEKARRKAESQAAATAAAAAAAEAKAAAAGQPAIGAAAADGQPVPPAAGAQPQPGTGGAASPLVPDAAPSPLTPGPTPPVTAPQSSGRP